MSYALPKPDWPKLKQFVRGFIAFVNSAAKLCGSLALIGGGIFLIGFHVYWLRLPDAVLMAGYPIDATVTGTRSGLLGMVAFGFGLAALGVGYFREWKKSALLWLWSDSSWP
jgi:hypothetical protein